MQLPIDCRRAPFREKYLVFETPVLNTWMVFGEYADGTVDISDGDTDILQHVQPEVAERIVAARNAFCQVVTQALAL